MTTQFFKHLYSVIGTSLSTSALLGILALGVGSLSACNTFDPNLGNAPFRCGNESPRCPDDYTCVAHSSTEELCESDSPIEVADGGMQAADAGGGFTCANDSMIEPNNSVSKATRSVIPSGMPMRLGSLAICPTGDEDFFRFDVPSSSNLTVEIEYLASRGTLHLELLRGDGSSVGEGTAVGGNANILRLALPGVSQGTYVVRVRGIDNSIKNNYGLEIRLAQ